MIDRETLRRMLGVFARRACALSSVPHDREDLVGAAACGVARGLRTWDPSRGARLFSYLFTCGHYAMFDEARRLSRLGRVAPSVAEAAHWIAPPADCDPETRLAVHEALRRLDELPLWRLVYGPDGLSITKASHRLGHSAATGSRRLRRAVTDVSTC